MLSRLISAAHRHGRLILIGALTLSSVLFAGVWLGAANAGSSSAVASFSGVKMTKFTAIDGVVSGCAPSTTFQDVPGAAKAFVVGGTRSRPVLVTVSLQAFANQEEVDGDIRLLIDFGQQGVGLLNWATLQPSSLPSIPLSYTFLTLALAPGEHTATVQWRKDTPGVFCISHWTMAILHV